MKRLFFQFSAVCLLLLTFSFHCLGTDTYTLQLNLEKGKNYKQHFISDMSMTMNAMGQEINIKLLSDLVINFEIIAQNNDGYDILASYTKIKINTTIPGTSKVISIDSDSPENSTDKKLYDTFHSIIGIPITVQITRQGKIKYIDGTDNLTEKFDVIANEQLRQVFSQQFTESSFRTTLQHIIAYFPDKPVAINDSWDIDMIINSSGVNILDKMHVTLKEVKDNIATLEDKGIFSTPEGGSTTQIQGVEAQVSTTGEQTGLIYMDMRTGWLTRSEITHKYKENIKFMGRDIVESFAVKTTVTAD